jgi:hypothetical protein
MRLSALVIAVVFFLSGQFLSVSSCYGQTVSTGNPPKVAPVVQAPTAPAFTPEQKETIREIVTKETSAWESLVGTYLKIGVGILAIIVTIFIFGVTHAVKSIKHKVTSYAQEAEKARDQAHKIVAELQTIRGNAEEQAEKYSTEIKAKGQEILADLGKAFTHRPRYIVTQGGGTAEPSWQFDVVLLFNTEGNSSVNGLLRTSGGTKLNEVTEEQKKEWQECTVTLHENKSITLKRPLTGTLAGNTQNFKGNPGPAQKIIKDNTAIVWEGTWSGYGADKADGAFIVYLD